MLRNTATTYGVVTRTLHWTIGLLIIALIGIGWYVVDAGYMAPNYQTLLDLHQSAGMLVLVLAALEIIWHVFSRPPGYIASLSTIERLAARAAHWLLYFMMFSIPLTGYIIATTEGGPVMLFGLVELPQLIETSGDVTALALDLHIYLAYATGVVAFVHVAAALKHHFINRDDTLRRMLGRA